MVGKNDLYTMGVCGVFFSVGASFGGHIRCACARLGPPENSQKEGPVHLCCRK